MIPLSDDNTARIRTPFINIGLIILNVLVFVYYQGFGTNQLFNASFATIPNEILTGNDVVYEGNIGVTPYSVYLTIFSAMFMHGGLAHLGGNLLYLWVFGDNLENKMGHFKYLLFYLLTGVIATFCHVGLCYFLQKDLYTPSLGASGAISGVLGGYLLLFPKNQVKVLLIAFIIRVPAFITLGLWIGLQLWSGWGSLGKAEGGGGVAYAAHIGGFVAGMLLVRYFVSSSDSIGRTRKKSYLR
jgi:membrane associated rhomboid family serine protease